MKIQELNDYLVGLHFSQLVRYAMHSTPDVLLFK